MKKLTQPQIIERLRKLQGERSARELAQELKISHVYLLHIYSGKREPGPAVLDKLGLQRKVFYTVTR